MRVCLDATALAGTRTGIGTLIANLVRELPRAAPDLDFTMAAFTLRGRHSIPRLPGLRLVPRPFPARLLSRMWQRAPFPPVEAVAGRCDVFHGTNYVLPPALHARGVVSIYDLTFENFPEFVTAETLRYRELVPQAIRRAGAVITISRAIKNEIIERYGVDESLITVTDLGVAPGWFTAQPADRSWRAARSIPDDYLVVVGSREPRKNIGLILRAYEAAGSTLPTLVLAGPAGWGDDPSDHTPGVIRTGYLPTPELQSLVAGARALVMPSRYEGFGLPVLEAMATGTPVIISSDPALVEIAGGRATVFANNELDALVGALENLPDDSGRQGRVEYARGWTWRRCAEQTAAVYRSLT